MLQDKNLKCKDCGVDFVFKVRGDEPTRCPNCRKANKLKKQQGNKTYHR